MEAGMNGASWRFGAIPVLPSNQATARPLPIQRKLEIGAVDDPLEHEADAVADRVMRMTDSASGPVQEGSGKLQRKCAKCEEENEEKRSVARKASDSGSIPVSAVAPPIIHEVLSQPGQALDRPTRGFFESRLQHDLSGVRIHSGPMAEESASAVNARAYTVGQHIVFGAGRWAPATDAGRRLLAHELSHTIQQSSVPSSPKTAGTMPIRTRLGAPMVTRQLQTKPAPPPPCTFNCTDPVFLALSPSAREQQFNTQCPQGFPATGTTFFSQPIPSVSSTTLRSKLLEAQSKAMRAMCLNGQDPNAYTLDRRIITYAGHSPGEAKAVDIDVQGQPYIMHEVTKGTPETDIDREVGAVYNRISFWSRYHKSIIPQGITSVTAGTSGTGRNWKNPRTGNVEPITTGELYDMLKEESTGMQGYFNLLLKSTGDLTIEVDAFLAFNTDPDATLTGLALPTDTKDPSVQAFRKRIANDYRLLGGSYDQLKAFAGKPIADLSKAPPAHHGDRPFEGGAAAGSTGTPPSVTENRRPELGFITLPKEVVVALTEAGLVWGAIDFGGASGDVMHFDCRRLPNC
jgi:hypothetical protein